MADFSEEILDFLKKNVLAVVSTVSSNNEPEAATVLYMIDDDLNFYFITRRDTRKVENLAINKNIAIVVGTELSPITIQANGEAELLDKKELPEFIGKLSKRKNVEELYYGPFLNIPGIDFAVFKVKLKWLRGLCLNSETKKEEFFQIIS